MIMKVKANTNPGTFSDEALHMITMIQEDIKYYRNQLEDYYNGCENICIETKTYYEQELIPQLEMDLEYYENYYLYE